MTGQGDAHSSEAGPAERPAAAGRAPWTARLALAAALALSLVRLGAFVRVFARRSLQMDFSAFYTAGEALNHGLSPYVNNFRFGIWDGVDSLVHSRFLYPPLVAALFQPLAAAPYSAAKVIWMLFALAALGVALGMAARAAGAGRGIEPLLGLFLAAALFYPLLTLLERGQIDTVTLLLVTAAAAWMTRDRLPRPAGRGDWRSYLAGAFLALACLLKLNIGFAAPFLLLRRQWRALAGLVGGALVLGAASLVVVGPAMVADYVHRELPRIERYGEGGPGGLPASDFRSLLAGVPRGETRQGARVYPDAYFGFVANGTLVRALQPRFPHTGQSRLSLELFAAFAAVMLVAEAVLRLRGAPPRGPDEFAYWNAVFCIVLLAGPLTWVMNVVWLLPAAAVVIGQARRGAGPVQAAALAVCTAGLIWAALPDSQSFSMLLPSTIHWRILADPWRYPVAELAVFVGLLGVVLAAPRNRPASARTAGEAGGAEAGR